MRWGLFLALVLLALAVLAPLPSLMGVPDPGAQCNPDAVFTDQQAHARAFGQWIFRQLSVLAILTAMAVFGAFYLQIFHYSIGRWGTMARLGLVSMLAFAAGWQLLGIAERWVLRQRTVDGPSCLLQALNTSASEKAAALSGSWLAAPPDRWILAARVDMVVLLVLGLLAGLAFYSLLRRLFRL